MTDATPEQLAHKRQAEDAIEEVLDILAARFDSKTLACMLFWRACKMLRGVHSIGIWRVEDVKNFTNGCMNDVLIPYPLEDRPGHAIIDAKGQMQPPNRSKLVS